MAAGYRGLARIAGGFLFVSLMCLSGPLALAGEQVTPEQIPNGLLCTDQMETEPGYDDLEPTEVADTVDTTVCQGSGTPVSI